MQNEIKSYFIFSLLIHLAVLAFLAAKFNRPGYITLPIEVKFYSAKITGTSRVQVKVTSKRIEKPRKKEKEEAIKVKKEKEKAVEEIREAAKPGQKEEAKSAAIQGSAPEAIEGSNISLDTKNFPYTYYTNTIVKKIAQNWSWSNKFGALKALVYFRIKRDGSVEKVEVKKPSGDDIFDQQAMRSIILASPFPPLPSGYKEEDLGVYFEFSITD